MTNVEIDKIISSETHVPSVRLLSLSIFDNNDRVYRVEIDHNNPIAGSQNCSGRIRFPFLLTTIEDVLGRCDTCRSEVVLDPNDIREGNSRLQNSYLFLLQAKMELEERKKKRQQK